MLVENTQRFRLVSLKYQLKLESLGLKSSGGAIRPRIAAEFGLRPRDSYDTYKEAVQAKIDSIKEVE
jgi:hypothetical protein